MGAGKASDRKAGLPGKIPMPHDFGILAAGDDPWRH
jgi:hypothetical protein